MNEEYLSKYLTGQDIDNALDKATTAVQPEDLDELKEDISDLQNKVIGYTYVLGDGFEGYVNGANGEIKTTVKGGKNSGLIEINSNTRYMVVKDSFRFEADGIAFFDADKNYVSGFIKTDFENEVNKLVVVPTNAVYFNVTWWENVTTADVFDFDYRTIDVIADMQTATDKNVYDLGIGYAGYVNAENGEVKTTIATAKNSGNIEIDKGVKYLIVKNSFRYEADGIAFYDDAENYISGCGKSYFKDEETKIIIVPENAIYFNVTWYTNSVSASVKNVDKKLVQLIESDVDFTKVKNVVKYDSLNTYIKWTSRSDITVNSDDTCTYIVPDTGNTGFNGKLVQPTAGKILTLFIDYSAGNPNTRLNAFLFGTNKSGQERRAENLHITLPQGRSEIQIDLNYIEVYGTTDITKPLSILIANATNEADVCTIKEFGVGYYNTEKDGYIGSDIVDTIANIKNKIEAIDVQGTEEVNYMVAPSGKKYKVQINENLDTIYIPVVPNKAVFFGNSLLLGFSEKYGIKEDFFGMAASRLENDYFYLFSECAKSINPEYTAEKYKIMWENVTNEAEYQDYTSQMLAHVDSTTDLIVIQLGDNTNNEAKKAVFPANAKRLITAMREKSPNARVVWVGAWFNSALIQEVMPEICKETGAEFIDISALNKPENQNVIGGKYYDTDGTEHIVENSGIATHPGDNGFRLIANRMLYSLGIVSDAEYYTSAKSPDGVPLRTGDGEILYTADNEPLCTER